MANPTLDNKGADKGMDRRVGFANAAGSLGDYEDTMIPESVLGYSAPAYTSNLYATTTGINASMYAKWYIDFGKYFKRGIRTD